MSYQHSKVFAELKGVKEAIASNLTSYQYLSVLDDLLYRSVYPIIEGTKFVDVFIAQVLGWQTQNPKRKTTGLGRHAFAAYVTLFYLSDTPERKLEVLKEMRLDRAIIWEAIRKWMTHLEGFKDLADSIPDLDSKEHPLLKLNRYEQLAVLRPGFGLCSIWREADYWYRKAAEFKEQILQKYTRLCLNTAQRDYVDLGHTIELDDLSQIYLLTASKAIDKCDTEKGVLTSHIQNWLLSAKNVAVAQYLSPHQKAKVGSQRHRDLVESLFEEVSIEDIEDLPSETYPSEDDNEDNTVLVRSIAKLFDPQGNGRPILGIAEVLSPEELDTLKALALQPYSVNS